MKLNGIFSRTIKLVGKLIVKGFEEKIGKVYDQALVLESPL